MIIFIGIIFDDCSACLFIIIAQYCLMFSAKSMTAIDRQMSKKVVKVIHGLLMMQQSSAFRKPVPHKALGLEDYKIIVKKPTDLNLIRRQNNEGKYKFVEEILDDIQLCWDNCKLYNALGSDIYEQALFMQKAFDRFGQQFIPQFWKDINRDDYNQKFKLKKIEEEKLKKPDSRSSNIKKEKLNTQLQHQDYILEENYPQTKSRNNQPSKFVGNYSDDEIQEEQLNRSNQAHFEENVQPQENNNDQPNNQKESMQAQAEQGPQVIVEPIMVNLNESPSRQQLMALSTQIKNVYNNGQYGLLQKVLQILHTNEKQNMSLNKNGLMTFKMNKIHLSTYYRIKKLIAEVNVVLIE